MSPPLLTAASTMMCPHGGTVMPVPGGTQVVAGAPVLRVGDTCTIVGCAFNIAGALSPCVTVQWSGPASHLTVGGAPALTEASVGLCLAAAQAPQGTVLIAATQAQVSGQ
jgi:hypothetical protein